jgi:CopG family nickel-responsive transcriptional regulator
MTVISVSLTKKNLELLDRIQEELGLAGRSETIRACLRSAEIEAKERDSLRGEVEGILIVVHHQSDENKLDESKHEYQEIITTQMHSHLRNGKCLDIFLVRGMAERVRKMLTAFKKDEGLEYVKFIQS